MALNPHRAEKRRSTLQSQLTMNWSGLCSFQRKRMKKLKKERNRSRRNWIESLNYPCLTSNDLSVCMCVCVCVWFSSWIFICSAWRRWKWNADVIRRKLIIGDKDRQRWSSKTFRRLLEANDWNYTYVYILIQLQSNDIPMTKQTKCVKYSTGQLSRKWQTWNYCDLLRVFFRFFS